MAGLRMLKLHTRHLRRHSFTRPAAQGQQDDHKDEDKATHK